MGAAISRGILSLLTRVPIAIYIHVHIPAVHVCTSTTWQCTAPGNGVHCTHPYALDTCERGALQTRPYVYLVSLRFFDV